MRKCVFFPVANIRSLRFPPIFSGTGAGLGGAGAFPGGAGGLYPGVGGKETFFFEIP